MDGSLTHECSESGLCFDSTGQYLLVVRTATLDEHLQQKHGYATGRAHSFLTSIQVYKTTTHAGICAEREAQKCGWRKIPDSEYLAARPEIVNGRTGCETQFKHLGGLVGGRAL